MMLFRNNLSSLVFLTGLSITAASTLLIDGFPLPLQTQEASLPNSGNTLPLYPGRGLSLQDLATAKTAWSYFQANTRHETGLVDAVAGFPSGTLWDQGSYLLALVAAERLALLSSTEFTARTDQFLTAMARLPLYQGHLPNKVYDTRTLAMVDYENQTAPEGVGWSALDVTRMLAAFRVLEHHHPIYGSRIRHVLAQWDLSVMTGQGRLIGAAHIDGQTVLQQEGRLGYEQYGARSAALWGLDVLDAATAKPILTWRDIEGVEVPTDQRRANVYKAVTPILSEPFLLQALEMGLTAESRTLAERVYKAQENRFHRTGIATMVSEGHIDRAPHFLYTSVYSNGQDWAVVAEDGSHHPDLRSVSLKAVIGWDALYNSEYTNTLREDLADLAGETGWASGKYEATGETNAVHTANTNAVILEALHYIAFGPLMQVAL
ncbi:DUF3131 domain-containing protein [Thalassobius sp. Cn5-15]|uniref:DUF3131 domain-containing protein n=1 Tax=Thalassobius sp. Cn5-15 TaxID=2917763 RepID=UPI001EF19380|nr:DUF3131 domain-containing protein [Thalassobius sp. Cn5-15]MCG7494627.1 DUF3131 domain-containing protein [Thalassobius sp. Cn5-15]